MLGAGELGVEHARRSRASPARSRWSAASGSCRAGRAGRRAARPYSESTPHGAAASLIRRTTRIVFRRPVAGAADEAAVGDAVGDVVERRPGQPLARAGRSARRAGRRRATRRRSGPRRRRTATTSWAARNASRGESSVGPQGGGSANGGSGSSLLLADPLGGVLERLDQPLAGARGALADPEDGDDDVLGEQLEVDVVAARASAARPGGRWRRCRGRRRPAAAGRRRGRRRGRRSARRARRGRGSRGSARAARPARRPSRRAAPRRGPRPGGGRRRATRSAARSGSSTRPGSRRGRGSARRSDRRSRRGGGSPTG